jgi:hypothetical protein
MKRSTIIFALLGLLVTPALAQPGATPPPARAPGAARPAQPGAPAKPGKPAQPGLEAKRQRLRQRILALRAAQVTATLGLDQQGAARLTATLGKWDQRIAGARRGVSQARQGLRAELGKPAPDGARINKLVDELMAQQRAAWTLQEDRFRELRAVLSPAQAARLLVLLPEIDRRIQKQIQKVMKEGKARRAARRAIKDPFSGAPPVDDVPTDGVLVDPFARGKGKGPKAKPGKPGRPAADPDLPDLQDPF